MASVLPIAGKIGDIFGRRRLILAGVIYFGIASIGATLASTLPILIIFRVQQAVAGAIAFPNGAALVREVVPDNRRARGFGAIGAVTSLAAASGPAIGGVLVDLAGWRAIFSVNLIIIVPALILALRTFPTSQAVRPKQRFDFAGSILLFLLLVSTVGVLLWQRQSEELRLLIPGSVSIVAIAALFVPDRDQVR